MHHDGLPVPTGKSKPPTGKGGRSNRLTQTDNHMHHTSIIIVILGKHIATMLRHNPYSLLRSTARTNLVERSYSQFFLVLSFFLNLLYRLVSLSRVSLCVSFPLFHFEPLNQTLNPGPEIEIDQGPDNTRGIRGLESIKPDTSAPPKQHHVLKLR